MQIMALDLATCIAFLVFWQTLLGFFLKKEIQN